MEIHPKATDATPVSLTEKMDPEAAVVEKTVHLTTTPVPLMDLDQGLVGWESETDPMNPLYVFLCWRDNTC